MAEDPTLSLRVSEIKDPAVLFEGYNTAEIRSIERKVRGEIEHKKEELRQMVGERYRDLIDAADTIGEMRQCSESVVRSIRDMHRYCHSLKQGRANGTHSGTQESQKQWQEKFYTMASQIKLLLEIPERIWSAMEACQYLQATQLYLLCCHLHGLLQLEAATGGHYSPVLARFPILVRQVATTGHFRSTILLDSRSLLRGRAVSDQAIAEALVSTMLLEDSSPRQALADFLLARKASIHQLLNQPQHGAGIKAQVCSLVELLVTTLFQAYAVFYLPKEGAPWPGEGALSCGMLFSILENVTSTTYAAKDRRVLQEETSTASWFKYLPPSITEFQPTLRTLAQPIQREQLRDTLQQWIDTCKEDICRGVGSLLVYVKSLKGLAAIRDAVWDLLSTDSISQHWSTVCQRLLERPLAAWDDFLQQLFLQRLQAITKEDTEAISMSSVQLLTSAVRDLEGQAMHTSSGTNHGSGRGAQYEVDVASFLWSESPGDLLSDAGWVSVNQRGQQHQRSSLAMKTQALTPCVQNFCSSLDAKLKARLDDLQYYLPSQDTGSDSISAAVPSSGPTESSSASSFNRFTDSPAVEEALREGCAACVRHILSSIRSELAAATPDPSPARLSSVLFTARLCQSMGELCPNLKYCILGKQRASEATAKGTPRQGKKLGKAKATEVSPAQAKWAGLKEELLVCSMEAYRIWSSALSKVLLDKFGAALHAESAGAILTTTTNWEDLEIQEEAESGSSVTSKISLPVQPSWFVQSLLFQLCVEVNRVGGHALPRPTLQELLQACLTQALHHYHSLTQQASSRDGAFPMTQNRALQLLFDLRYLNTTLGSRPEEGKSSRSHQDPRFHEVCDWLEGYIDPFDLDVFTPPLNTNLNRMSQRTSVLLGLLTGSEKQFALRSSSLNSQEPYNILPLASSQIRFGLLPLSMSSVRKSKSATRTSDASHQLQAPPSSSSSAAGREDSFRPGSLFRQLADQDEDAAAPSLFKLSWLSGMAK
ncbi:conserved oligomeric Golgi complex subunit 1 isoform X1 [Perca flavescens]|uniref:conserved oligomeric Golgi complex subunit 1 isoform X1 n=1 Tax=Perca flavescens TaxID=8167 RepID=UPI00106DF2B1|nr:conserved oligomeric Golgi complex subunit 1 isoform X1 [Perca flavescens]XP_028455469.1 conserved oligomeric Golgi complex subunit 1 isoform X1 [Perca flavescens]